MAASQQISPYIQHSHYIGLYVSSTCYSCLSTLPKMPIV